MSLQSLFLMIAITFVPAQLVDVASNVLEPRDTQVKVIEADVYFLIDKAVDVRQTDRPTDDVPTRITYNIEDIGDNFTQSSSDPKLARACAMSTRDLLNKIDIEKVEIKLYYESLCPDCKLFVTLKLVAVMQKLSDYLDIKPYPYGNAKMKEHDGQYIFTCQHGPEECYGNKLHACAIDILHNMTAAIYFNSCMMEPSQNRYGSDDLAADVCGKSMDIDPEPIKRCAKSGKGTQLLKYYGDESKKVGYNYVPYILVNGVLADSGGDFMKIVCEAFKNPPKPCGQELYSIDNTI